MPENADSQSAEEEAFRHQRVMEIVAEFHSRLTPESRALATTDDLYDEDGLPA